MREIEVKVNIDVTKVYRKVQECFEFDKKACADAMKELIKSSLDVDNVIVLDVQEIQMEDIDVLNEFVKERDSAFINFVETGSMEMVDAYCKKYGISMPEDSKVKQAGIYKAVQACINIPEEIKNKAMVKCMELGFNPFMKEWV